MDDEVWGGELGAFGGRVECLVPEAELDDGGRAQGRLPSAAGGGGAGVGGLLVDVELAEVLEVLWVEGGECQGGGVLFLGAWRCWIGLLCLHGLEL